MSKQTRPLTDRKVEGRIKRRPDRGRKGCGNTFARVVCQCHCVASACTGSQYFKPYPAAAQSEVRDKSFARGISLSPNGGGHLPHRRFWDSSKQSVDRPLALSRQHASLGLQMAQKGPPLHASARVV